jgi:hypothetical protein
MATVPVTICIRIILPEGFQPEKDHIFILRNHENERLMAKIEEVKTPIPGEDDWEEVVLLISRYPLASTKQWIVENEKEVRNWESGSDKTIYLRNELKVVAI